MSHMTINKLTNILQAEVLWGNDLLHKEISVVCASDLMSDVLAFAESGCLLLTGLTNAQVVRTAEMAEIAVICFVRGKRPQDETIQLAKEKEIPLLATQLFMYQACGFLYHHGLAGHSQRKEQ